MKLIDFIIDKEMKNSELKILKFIDQNEKVNITKLVEVANWYQIRETIPKLKKLGLIIENEGLKLNYNNEVIKTLFDEI